MGVSVRLRGNSGHVGFVVTCPGWGAGGIATLLLSGGAHLYGWLKYGKSLGT